MTNTAVYTANACTLVPDTNSTYLYKTHTPVIIEPMSGSTMGLMMLLSTLQYQSSYLPSQYSDAANRAGQAAFIQSGGKAMQDKMTNMATKEGQSTAYSLGLTDFEMGATGLIYKTIRSKQVNIKGPSIGPVKTTLQGTQNSGTIGFKYEW